MLLNFSQIRMEFPNVLTVYSDPKSVLVHDVEEIKISEVLMIVQPPSIILRFDRSSQCLHQFTLTVSYTVMYLSQVVNC